jgi:hypothetical protein
MRALLFTVLVSFNLVACVTGDNDAEENPPGEITAAPVGEDLAADLDNVADLSAGRAVPTTASQGMQQPLPTAAGGAQHELKQELLKPPGGASQTVPTLDVPSIETQQHVVDQELSAEELQQIEQDELHGKVLNGDLPEIK